MKSQRLFEERYKKLNKAQKEAVDNIDGPLLVVAGPGSGKTEILSLRVAKILTESQVLPSNILCLTFTESAAVNMRERLAKLIGEEAYRVAIHTFHSFASEVIQKYPEYFYKGARFAPADDLAQIGILESIFKTLPYSNPFSSFHPEQGYVFLSSVHSSISNLKKAGILPDEFRQIIQANAGALDFVNKNIDVIFSPRVSKDVIPKIEKFVYECQLHKDEEKLPEYVSFSTLYESIAQSLALVLSEVKENEDLKPVSKWKEKWVIKIDDDKRAHKDTKNIEKLFEVASIYEKYIAEMHRLALYDFDDMILDMITAVKEYPHLRFELEEQYQYMLVDEFQDTNDAQMRLLRIITDASVNEGRPNVMVVGDDDQAVYKFQGAELSNILNFTKIFKDVKVVTLTNNYRSTQDILDLSSHIIRKGEGRLENILPGIEKALVASNKDLGNGNIVHRRFSTALHQYHFVSREIAKLVESGVSADEIAVIARKHKELEALVPYMKGANVSVRYEREQNVFEEPHIEQLITMARFLATLGTYGKSEADEFMPIILSFPFWEIPRQKIWEISLAVSKTFEPKKTWLEVMLESDDDKIKSIAEFFIDLGVRSLHEPAERVLDELVGAHMPLARESEDEDEEAGEAGPPDKKFYSTFKEYYFSKEKFEHARAEYLTFLSSLRVFVKALREFKKGEMTTVSDLVEFVELHEKNNIRLNDQSPFNAISDAVSLLTAHKAKGLEFEYVFVLSCEDNIWAGRGAPKRISFPQNMPIEPVGDTVDDQLRLFYVALTRAKKHLYLTGYSKDDKGGESQKLRFLLAPEDDEEVLKKAILKQVYHEAIENTDDDAPETSDVLTSSWLSYHTAPFIGGEEKLLKSLLKDYALSVTHLNNFLNVGKGGPQHFLEQNLLRFPQAKSVSGSYGSAIHASLEEFISYKKAKKVVPSKEEFCSWFLKALRYEKLPKLDFEKLSQRGVEALEIFYDSKADSFNETDVAEFNFKHQGVQVEDANLSGKIDRIVYLDRDTIEVHDYKTGKSAKDWKGKDEYEKIKLYEYERQLCFYKLLVENSREFTGKKVTRGVLEFVEPSAEYSGGNKKVIDLELDIEDEKVERLKRLIGAVHKKIQNLDFEDVSSYSPDLDGIVEFEEKLLASL
jgi:DNA helicase II / ATP-dependent DNA helicase PcrA